MTGQKIYPEGLLAEKVGMTQIFTESGECVPVTVLRAGPNVVLDYRSKDKNGYSAVQFGFEPTGLSRLNKAEKGHFQRAGAGAFRTVQEVRCNAQKLGWTELGKQITPSEVFSTGDLVDVTGISKGRGFSGVVRRFKSKGQPMTRGTHEVRRHIGSVGCRKFPGRIFKNKKNPGQLGNEQVTLQNLKVVEIIPEDQVILVRGCVPGAKGGMVVVRKAVKGLLDK